MLNIKQLQEEVNALLVKSEEIRAKYDGKSADMTGQEQQEWENILAECDQKTQQIEALRKEEKIRDWASKSSNALVIAGDGKVTKPEDEQKAAERAVFRKFLVNGEKSLTEQDYAIVKAYQADNPAGGGFLVAPQELAQEIITLLKDLVFVRKLGRVFTQSRAESMGFPAIDTDPSDSDWTTELAVGNEETTMAFGKRELKPNPLAKYIKESNKLLRQVPNAENHIMDRLAYKFAITEEKAFLTGSGADQPLGVFTASAAGISTARDVTAATTTTFTGDNIIDVVYKLKAQYRKNASWIINRTVLQFARKLKDSNNNYLWATGIGPGTGFNGTPPTLFSLPYNESEYSPNTFTTGLYLAALGDWSRYYIVDALDMQMQVLDQLFALNNQTGYILRKETDGMPVLEEAFARLILA